jgi:hypothetical protein
LSVVDCETTIPGMTYPERPDNGTAVPDVLETLDEAIQMLSDARHQLTGDGAAPDRRHYNKFPRFERHPRPSGRVA